IVALEQIPATVIDKGILKNVPYLSHRSGDYEFNVYGDPEAPSGIEIGIYNQLLADPSAKERCVNLMVALLDKERGSKLARLKRDEPSLAISRRRWKRWPGVRARLHEEGRNLCPLVHAQRAGPWRWTTVIMLPTSIMRFD